MHLKGFRVLAACPSSVIPNFRGYELAVAGFAGNIPNFRGYRVGVTRFGGNYVNVRDYYEFGPPGSRSTRSFSMARGISLRMSVGLWLRRGCATILLAGWVSGLGQAQEGRLDGTARPLKQAVFLHTAPASDSFRGSTQLSLQLVRDTKEIRLHAQDITLDKAVLIGEGQTWTLTAKPAADETVTLLSPSPLKAGAYRLELEFHGPYNRRSSGLYKYADQGLPYLSTQFEMSHARLCFPCFDEPAFKIPFQLTVEAPKGQSVYSNTPETKLTEQGDWMVHEFAPTPPMPSYLVALAVGPFESAEVEKLSVPGRIVAPRGKIGLSGFARRETPRILGALEGYFGIEYPYPKLDQVAVTEFPHGAMENAGMVTYREDLLLINESTVQQDAETASCMVISHELAHQWFGNLVTMKWWNDLWLNEAFATWMATKIVNQLYPELEYQLSTPQNRVLGSDANVSTKPIRKPIRNEADIFDGLSLAYNKGSAVLNMVERWIGEKTFQSGMRAYLSKYRFGNAEAADLWQALGAASDKDVEAVLKAFTEQSGFPLISVTPKGKTLLVSQTRFLNAGVSAPEQTWTLPLFFRYGAGSREAVATLLLDSPSANLELEFEPEWIFPDDGAVGYFRWQLPKPRLERLLAHRDRLSNREKLALMWNLQALVNAGVLSAGESLELVVPFLSEDHPSVVGFALSALDANRQLFVHEGNKAGWRSYLKTAIAPVVERFGLTPREGEPAKVQDLRPLLLRLLADELDDEELIATATGQAREYLAGSSKVDPSLADAYLRIAARHGDAAMVEEVKTAMVEASDPQRRTTLLRTLGMFARPEAQSAALNLMLDPSVTSSDLRTLLAENGQDEARRKHLLSWLETHYEALAAKLPTPFLGSIPSSVGDAPNAEELDRVLAFFSKQPDPTGALGRELAKIEERVSTSIATRQRGQESFDAFLKGR